MCLRVCASIYRSIQSRTQVKGCVHCRHKKRQPPRSLRLQRIATSCVGLGAAAHIKHEYVAPQATLPFGRVCDAHRKLSPVTRSSSSARLRTFPSGNGRVRPLRGWHPSFCRLALLSCLSRVRRTDRQCPQPRLSAYFDATAPTSTSSPYR